MATKEENIKYWNDRETEYIKKALKDQEAIAKAAGVRFDDLIDTLSNTIENWLNKYANEEGITMAEAKKKVETADIERLKKRAAKVVASKDFSPLANQDMRLYNLTMRINRLEYLMADIGITLAEFQGEHEAFLYESFNKLAIEEYEKQSAVLGQNVKGSSKQINQVVTGSYQAGEWTAIWSERLWQNNRTLKLMLDRELTQAIIAGENSRKVAQRIRKATNQSRYAAERLARTELARIQGDIQLDSYTKAGVKRYIYIAEPNACKACKPLDDRIFDTDKKEIGKNFYPMHPNCRCSSAPYIDREEVENRLLGMPAPSKKTKGNTAYKVVGNKKKKAQMDNQ